MTAIINGTIIHNKELLYGYTLLFDEKIISLSQEQVPSACSIIDAQGSYVSAGFVDIHIHGSAGADVMDGSHEALETISQSLLKTGTTSFLATTMTMAQEDINRALNSIISYGSQASGAKIEGIHLEGPFINPSKCGAQNPRYIQEPNFAWIEEYLPHIRVITLAPEMQKSESFIKDIKKRYPHILFSIGHSEASYEIALESIEWGVSHVTHLFNAMPPWHHRKPSIIGAVFDSDITVDLIADLIHSQPNILRTIQKLKRNNIVLITDAMRAGCMQSGEYDLGGQSVKVEEGKALLSDGTLAGSLLTLNRAIKNFSTHTASSLAESIYAATTLPAKVLHLPIGELIAERSADIVIFDEDITIQKVLIAGKLLYTKE